MPTLLERLEAQHRDQLAELRTVQTDIDALIASVDNDPAQRTALTSDETDRLTQLRARRDQLEDNPDGDAPGLRQLDERIAQIRADVDAARRTQDTLDRLGVRDVRVTRESSDYRPDGSHSFFCDLYARTFNGDHRAAERLDRNTQVVLDGMGRRDIVVSDVAGVVPPQYLVDQYAPLARAGRPFANSLNSQGLPSEGISFTIPRITTGSAGAMTSEGSGWNEQNIAATNLTRTVEMVTAQQDLSRTLFMRGGALVDTIVMGDLVAASEVALNVSLLSGDGNTPNHLGVLSVSGISAVTYTDASPTVGELWPKLADAIQRINAGRYAPATAIYMHPRRWGWITAAVDTTGRPLFNFSTDPPNVVMGLGQAAEYGQIVGSVQGLPVITDASIPTNLGAGTNEDIIAVVRSFDLLYWEDPVMQFTMEQAIATAPAQVRLAAGRFALAMFGRYPLSISTIGGTGLVTPTF